MFTSPLVTKKSTSSLCIAIMIALVCFNVPSKSENDRKWQENSEAHRCIDKNTNQVDEATACPQEDM